MNQRAPEKVVPFAPSPRDQRPNEGDPIDRSGHAIVGMLQEAVLVAKQNCERAMDIAHKLSLQLRAAEDRIAQVRAYVDRERARLDQLEPDAPDARWVTQVLAAMERTLRQFEAHRSRIEGELKSTEEPRREPK